MVSQWCHRLSDSALPKGLEDSAVNIAKHHEVAPTLYVPIPTKPNDNSRPISQLALFVVLSCSESSVCVLNRPRLLRTCPLPSAMVRFCPKSSPTSSRSPHSRIHLRATAFNAICIHQPCQSQLLISIATRWRNLLLNHPPRRLRSSVLFCLKLKVRCAQERRTNKSGNGSPTPASISAAKRFADSFAGHARKGAYPRRWAGKVSKSRSCTPKKLRPARNTIL